MLDWKGWNKIIKSVQARYENNAPTFKNDVTYFHTWRWAGWCASQTRDDIYTRWRHPPRDTPRSRRMRVDNASADRPPAPQTERQSLEPAPQWRPPGWCSTPHSSCIHRWGCSGRRWRAVLEGIAAETNRRAVVLIDGGGCCGEAAKAGVVDGGCPHWVDVDDLEEASVGWVLQRLRGDHRSRSAGMLRRVSDRRTYKRKWFFVWHLTS